MHDQWLPRKGAEILCNLVDRAMGMWRRQNHAMHIVLLSREEGVSESVWIVALIISTGLAPQIIRKDAESHLLTSVKKRGGLKRYYNIVS